MVVTKELCKNLIKARHLSSVVRREFTGGRIYFNKTKTTEKVASTSAKGVPENVPGLSASVVQLTSDPVGPGAAKNKDYKNVEYFCYNNMSYFEAEIEMAKYRLPQPSSKV